MRLDPGQRRTLLALARTSIEAALRHGAYVDPQLHEAPIELLAPRASFVTVRDDRGLRGCIGTLEASRPLAESVWRYAHAAAFHDPRFEPITHAAWRRCHLHISVLTQPEPITVASETELLATLRPGADGLILERGSTRATFLPAVWDDIVDAATFVRQLKLKAGWRADFWAADIRVWRYESESFGEE